MNESECFVNIAVEWKNDFRATPELSNSVNM